MNPVADVAHSADIIRSQNKLIPKNFHLVITTPDYVYSWNNHGLTEIFHSGSGGIIAAKQAHNGSATLAVADSQVVILHDIGRGINRSYKLKGTEGQVHLLQYANDSKSLFFTTSLQNSVQSCSLTDSCLPEPAFAHPTPPSVIAVSPTSHLLLSASDAPPTIYLHDLQWRKLPLLLQPSASDAVVVAAAFHPEHPDTFLLGFADGTLAAYNVRFLIGGERKRQSRSKVMYTGRGGEIGHFKKLHTTTSKGAQDPDGIYDPAVFGGYDEGTKKSSPGSISIGITSAAFLPGYQSRAVTVGGDGRCRMVDFAGGGKVLRTWHLQGAATSLSICSYGDNDAQARNEQPAKLKRFGSSVGPQLAIKATVNNIIAVGRDDGYVQLYDSLGLLLFQKQIDPLGGRIIDVEWVKGPGYRTQATIPERPARHDSLRDAPANEENHDKRLFDLGISLQDKPIGGRNRKSRDQAVMAAEIQKERARLSDSNNAQLLNEKDGNDGTVRRNSTHVPGQRVGLIPSSQPRNLFSAVERSFPSQQQGKVRIRIPGMNFALATTEQTKPARSDRRDDLTPTENSKERLGSPRQPVWKASVRRQNRKVSFAAYRRMPGAYLSSSSSLSSNGSGRKSSRRGSKQQRGAIPSFPPNIVASEPRQEQASTNWRSEDSIDGPNADTFVTEYRRSDTNAGLNQANLPPGSRTSSVSSPGLGRPSGIEEVLAGQKLAPAPPVPPRSPERPARFKLRSPSISPRKQDGPSTAVGLDALPLFSGDQIMESLEVGSSRNSADRPKVSICACGCEELRTEVQDLKEHMHADILVMREEMAEGFRRLRVRIGKDD